MSSESNSGNSGESVVQSRAAYGDVYHSSGLRLRMPFPEDGISYGAIMANVEAALSAGFMVELPGAEPGEHREDCGYVVLREKTNDDGTVTPLVDLYPVNEQTKFKFLSVYLNNDEQVAAFEAASGMKLSSMQPYEGVGNIERGANARLDRLVYKAPRPFQVYCKDNPRYDPNETDTKKKKPKRLFSRWGGQSAAPANSGQPSGGQRSASQSAGDDVDDSRTVDAVQGMLDTCQYADEVADGSPVMNFIATNGSKIRASSKAALWNRIKGLRERLPARPQLGGYSDDEIPF